MFNTYRHFNLGRKPRMRRIQRSSAGALGFGIRDHPAAEGFRLAA
jgi:hypothetical protein